MPGLPELVRSFAFVILIPAFFYLVGYLVFLLAHWGRTKGFIPQRQQVFFSRIFVGLFFTAGLYAIIHTSFNTSLLPVPILVLFIARYWPTGHILQPTKGRIWNPIVCMLLAAFLCFVYFTGQLYWFVPGDNMASLGGDSEFYARVANYMNETREETLLIDPTGILPPHHEPYHYGDIWLLALIQKVTGLSPMVVVYFVLYPLLAGILSMGLFNYLLSAGIKPNPLLLSFATLFSGFSFLFPAFLFDTAGVFRFSLIEFLKLLLPAIGITATMESLNARNWNNSLLLVILISICSISLAPSLILTAVLGIAVGLMFRKFHLDKKSIVSWGLGLLSGIYFLLFYILQPGPSEALPGSSINLKTTVNIIGGGLLQLIQLMPFFLLGLLIHSSDKARLPKSARPALRLLIIAVGMGLLLWSVIYAYSYEFIQFYYNILAPAVAIILVHLFSLGLSSTKKVLKYGTIFLAVMSILMTIKPHWDRKIYNRKDVETANKFISEYGEGISANLKGSASFSNVFSRNTLFSQPLPFLSWLYPRYYNVSLNTADMDKQRLQYPGYERRIIRQTPFYVYTTLHPGKTRETQGFEFLKQYKLRYLFIGADTLIPQKWRQLVRDSVTLTDKSLIYYIGE